MSDEIINITDLPKPPPGKSGWPWTESSLPMPRLMPNGFEWTRISIVTPSYNQEQYIEETIRSVLLQGYPNLDYIIIDGGSRDGSVEIVRKYEKYLTYWVSESDGGQSHAINKGFAKSSGNILCWINSDDMFKPGTLEMVARIFPDTSIPAWLIGSSEIIDSKGAIIRLKSPKNISFKNMLLWHKNWFPQQSTFWTRPMWEVTNSLDESLYYAMDFSLWINMFKVSSPILVENPLACYRFQDNAKCLIQPDKAFAEILVALLQHIQLKTKNMKFQFMLIDSLIKVAFDYSLYMLKKTKIAKIGKKVYKSML